MIVSFTGHRPSKLGGYILPNPTYLHVCREIDKALQELKPEKIITGMALGVDQWAANIAIRLGIPFIAAVPFVGQEKAWPQASQKIFNKLLEKAAEVVIVSEGEYSAYKMQIRNEWMVDRADKIIAIWDGSKGGTGNCVEYAKSKGKEIFYIDPRLTMP